MRSKTTLTAARRLKEAGASEPMAEAIVEAIREAREQAGGQRWAAGRRFAASCIAWSSRR